MARRLACTGLTALQQPAFLQQLAPLAQLGCSSGASRHYSRRSEEEEQPQQQEQQQGQQQALPSLPSLLRASSGAGRTLLPTMGLQAPGSAWGNLQQVRGMAGGGLDPTTAENTWLAYKSKYAEEKPNDLGQAMYALILTFGFSWWLNSIFAYPPRVALMLGVVFCECAPRTSRSAEQLPTRDQRGAWGARSELFHAPRGST